VNWPVYNQSLVRRGEILIGFDVIDNWETKLKEANKDNFLRERAESKFEEFIYSTLF
jgi:hypothetical protein